MDIRKAEIGEETRILQFYHDLIDDMRDMEYRPAWQKGVYPTIEGISSAVTQGTMYVMEDDGRIVSACILNHTQGEGYDRVAWACEVPAEHVSVLHLLATSPRVQGRGLARQMLTFVRDVSVQQGDRVIRLDTLPWNKPGKVLYERFGFQYRGDMELDYACTGTIPFSMYEYVL